MLQYVLQWVLQCVATSSADYSMLTVACMRCLALRCVAVCIAMCVAVCVAVCCSVCCSVAAFVKVRIHSLVADTFSFTRRI